DSSMARDADAVLYTHAGPEIGVAATKTFLAQVTALQLFALYLAQVRGTVKPEVTGQLLAELHRLPDKIETVVGLPEVLTEVADALITVPATEELFTPAIDVVALQLLSYWVAKFRGTDVDMPRNLAKTVTVE